MSAMRSPRFRFVAAFLFAAGLVLATVLPGLTYNEENVKHVRVERLSPIECKSTVRLRAHLTDKDGGVVVGAEVNWTLKKGQSGDALVPVSPLSDGNGDHYADLQLSEFSGNRIVVATVAGTKAKGQITINAKKSDGCEKQGKGEGAVEGATGTPFITLPPTTTTPEFTPAAAGQVLPVVGILSVIGIMSLLATMAWRKRSTRRLPPA
jgi:hypothetical protein